MDDDGTKLASAGAHLVDGAPYPVGDSSMPVRHIVQSSESDLYYARPLSEAAEHGVMVDGVVAHNVDQRRVDPREPLGVNQTFRMRRVSREIPQSVSLR